MNEQCENPDCTHAAKYSTGTAPHYVCSEACVIAANIGSDAGDKLAREISNPSFTVAFDFDLTITGRHSCLGSTQEEKSQKRDMSSYIHSEQLDVFLKWLAQTNRMNWIISFGSVETIRLSLMKAGIADHFRVKEEEVPPIVRAHVLFPRLSDRDYFWRILTPSVMFGIKDCTQPGGEMDKHKVSFMNTALTITNLFLESTALLSPKDFLLIDDSEANVSAVTKKGYSGLAISGTKTLVGSLDFEGAKGQQGPNWLRVLFDHVYVVRKEDILWGLGRVKEEWNYYKID